MANYYGMTRSNYFHVTDAERLKAIISATHCDEDHLEVWSKTDEQGNEMYAFGGYSSIIGLPASFTNEQEEEDEDFDVMYDALVDELQKILVDGDAIIITEIGNEKLRYFNAYAYIITKHDCEFVELRNHSIETACRMLGNPKWDTRMEY